MAGGDAQGTHSPRQGPWGGAAPWGAALGVQGTLVLLHQRPWGAPPGSSQVHSQFLPDRSALSFFVSHSSLSPFPLPKSLGLFFPFLPLTLPPSPPSCLSPFTRTLFCKPQEMWLGRAPEGFHAPGPPGWIPHSSVSVCL